MKRILLLIFLLSAITHTSYAQCTGCTQTYNGSGGTNFNLNAGDVLCITGNASNLSLNFNGAATICVAAGVSWNATNTNFSNNPTINVYGTLQLDNANFNSPTTINVQSAGVFNSGISNFNGNLTVNNSGTFNLTNTGTVSIQGNTAINNLAGGIFNGTIPSKVVFVGSSATLVNNNIANFRNLENNEGDITNNAGATVNVKGELYNHGEFKNYGKVVGTCDGEPLCEFRVGNKGAGKGFKNLGGQVDFSGNTIFEGAVINDGLIYVRTGNLSINNPVTGTNGQIIVAAGTSTIGAAGCYTGTGLKFCDQNTSGNGFDAINNPGCSVSNWTIDCNFTILPVRFVSFSSYESNGETYFRWAVSDDFENDFYVLQRSEDGRNFQPIQTIQSSNSTTGITTYNSNKVETNNAAFYRIAANTKSGRIIYTNIIRLGGKVTAVKFYPNPTIAGTSAFIDVPQRGKTIVNFYSVDGSKLNTMVFEGQTRYSIAVPNNYKGQMIVEVLNAGNINRFKITSL